MSGSKNSSGGNKNKLIIGAIAAVALLIIGFVGFSLLNKDKAQTPAEQSVGEVSDTPTTSTVILSEDQLAQPETNSTTDTIDDVGNGNQIVDNRSNILDEEPVDSESDETEDELDNTTESNNDATDPTYSNESYLEIVTPKIDEPELLETKLRAVLGEKYESLDDLKEFGIEVLSYDRVSRTGYIRVSKALAQSHFDITEHISTVLSLNETYEDGTQTARVTFEELIDLIDLATNPTDEVVPPTNDRSSDNNGVQNPVVDDNTDNETTGNNGETASETEEHDPMVGTMSGGEDFAGSCYRVDESEPYDFDYLINHINWSLSMSDKLVSVGKQNMSLNDEAAKDYIVVTLDPGIFCPSGRINFADFKKDLEASPYFVAYRRSGNTFSLVTDKTLINQGYSNTALAKAVNNIQ